MKITNLKKGEDYQLSADAKLEVERVNPFFNDWGEMTVPMDMPASEHNRRLLDYPDMFGRREKMIVTEASIQDGEYHAQCRQVVISATRKGSISTSFYINDGSFYSRIRNVKLKDIFKDEFVPDVDTVEQGIEFCRKLRDGSHPRYAIFPVLVDDDSGIDGGMNYKVINAYGKEDILKKREVQIPGGGTGYFILAQAFFPNETGEGCDFYNAVGRTEYVNQIPVTLPAGYYITPFVRANYVLERIFRYFGYTLKDNFFTKTDPFRDMVILNNVIDVLANGKIKVADLVPDITCTDFLSVFRKKFCCEFTSDEGSRTADVIFLREALGSRPVADLTRSLVEEPTISYKSSKDFKRIVLSSKDAVSPESTDNYDDLGDMSKSAPGAYLDMATGAFYKDGFSGDYRVVTKIGEASQSYNTGEDMDTQEIEIPDCIPEFRTLQYSGKVDDTDYIYTMGTLLYIGSYSTLNSKMVVAEVDNQEASDKTGKLLPMLAFAYMSASGKPAGTISPCDLQLAHRPRIFDYALYYNGTYGIFEKFYRDYDTLLRNALQEMKMKLLLSQSEKQNLPAHAKVTVRGVPFFFNKLMFTLGGKNEPMESDLRTVTLSEPVVSSPYISDIFPAISAGYQWVGKIRQTEVGSGDYDSAGIDKDRTFRTVYPPIPSASWVGKQYGKQVSYTSQQLKHRTFFRHSKWKYTKTEVWLECEAK